MRHKTEAAQNYQTRRWQYCFLPVIIWVLLHSCPGIFPTPAFAADKWLSIHTKNFLLVGNAGESDIRRVGRTLEEFRSAIAMMFPRMEQTSSAPITVLIFKND